MNLTNYMNLPESKFFLIFRRAEFGRISVIRIVTESSVPKSFKHRNYRNEYPKRPRILLLMKKSKLVIISILPSIVKSEKTLKLIRRRDTTFCLESEEDFAVSKAQLL